VGGIAVGKVRRAQIPLLDQASDAAGECDRAGPIVGP
jgi:hypothetical protein